MRERDSQPVLILGMHRSGTSYLASRLAAFGLQLGTNLVGPQKGNERGHFEDVDILAFHESLLIPRLSSTGRAFDMGMMQMAPVDFDPTDEERKKAQLLIADREQVGLWGWKEPRTALFIDFWKGYLPNLKGIVIYRHPWAVHNSMRRREHWDLLMFPDQVFKSYTVYNESLLRAIEAQPNDYLVINAESAFSQMERLDDLMGGFLGATIDKAMMPTFYPQEFEGEAVTQTQHALIGEVVPEATAVFDRLEQISKLPYVFKGMDPDGKASALLSFLQGELADLGKKENRSAWIPLVEEYMLSDPGAAVALRTQMAEAMGEKIRNMQEWHQQAEKIFKEAEWVEAERKRLSLFLKKQTTEYQKIWSELTKVGESWNKQREYIEHQSKEMDHLKAIIAEQAVKGEQA